MIYSGNCGVRRPAIGNKATLGGIAALVLLIILIVASFFIGQTLVYIFLILAALVSLIAFALLAYAALQLIGLIQELRTEVTGLVDTTK